MKEFFKEFVIRVFDDLLSARTIFALMFYGTFCYLVLHKFQIPQELNSIISALLGYYFGSKGRTGGENGEN